jgi:N-dimethylarginine dimethylaminohydrolase
MSDKACGGHTMAGTLRRVLVCAPETAGWDRGAAWRDLGYFHSPELGRASEQHAALVAALENAGAEVLQLPADDGLSLDAVYAHDASFPSDHGMIVMRMGKPTRRGESHVHTRWLEAHEIPVLGWIEPPGLTEGGDMVWLDKETVLMGEGYRTNADGIEQVRRLLAPFGVGVVTAPLPYGPGPDACLHLMSLLSILDERVALVDLPWLSVSTVRELEERGFHLIPIEERERASLACNVLALGGRKLLALAENETTNARLESEGFEVATYPGSEISLNGSGGPTCLTRPLLRG